MEVVIRPAGRPDVEELLELRRDFTFEDDDSARREARPDYEAEFRAFLADAVDRGTWQIWVAEADGRIVAHVFVALVDKVPRPVRENRRIAYLTNVYTRPAYRGRGIGGRLLERAQAAAREADVELVLVWPSEESVCFYRRFGFDSPGEPLVWKAD